MVGFGFVGNLVMIQAGDAIILSRWGAVQVTARREGGGVERADAPVPPLRAHRVDAAHSRLVNTGVTCIIQGTVEVI